jgi:leucyl aminopeptidase
MKISFAEPSVPKSGAIVVLVADERRFSASAERLDKETGGALKRAVEASRFKGKKDEVLAVLAPANLTASRVVLAGLGKSEAIDAKRFQDLGGTLVAHLNGAGESEAAVLLDPVDGFEGEEAAANLAYGARLRSYRFAKYRTKEKPEKKPSLERCSILSASAPGAKKRWQSLDKVADGVLFTRDLVSEPANVIFPESLAEQAKTLETLGVKVEVLDEKRMKELGMGALLGVGQGSANPPRLVVMQWNGEPKAIKPAAGMEDMKWDMAGAGVVIGLMKALAGRKAKVNAVGIVGLVENMPSGTAQRPGDIVKSMSGQTIEVLNTDAEGRLVLADALWYCQDRFKPRFMIDLATLTGAIIVALGHENAGLFSNNDELSERIVAAGRDVGELCWRLPLSEAYDKEIDCDAADMKNISGGRAGSSITAAQFLQRFVNDVPWAHLDIAGTAWASKDKPTIPKGATAFGVRLLERLVAQHYES